MKDKIIQSFTIKGLFGLYDVHIPFENDVMILIGENGMGKTQIMNLLYYILSNQLNKINTRNINAIGIELENKKHTLTASEIGILDTTSQFEGFTPMFGTDVIIDLNEKLRRYEILHLPTYRRVEEVRENLGYNLGMTFDGSDNEPHRDTLMEFGDMIDVSTLFFEITQEIQRLSKEGLSKISSEVLSELINGDSTTETDFLDTINENDIDIILARVGDDIDENAKNKIRSIVATKEIQNKDRSSLYFLKKLINAYDSQRELDNSIKTFRDICNKYLINKTLVYDESKIDIYVKINQNNQRIDLNDLSFGEKQIISIFSKIYLSPPDSEFIVLIDEPELSLSIFWQRNFLPDIYNSGKIRFLFAVTHSPFIFENELDKYAVSLNEYIKPAAPAQIEQPA